MLKLFAFVLLRSNCLCFSVVCKTVYSSSILLGTSKTVSCGGLCRFRRCCLPTQTHNLYQNLYHQIRRYKSSRRRIIGFRPRRSSVPSSLSPTILKCSISCWRVTVILFVWFSSSWAHVSQMSVIG